MTSVDLVFRYEEEPTEQAALALAHVHDVYGIRSLSLDRAARTLAVEFDATRLNAATVMKLIREAGVEIADPAQTGARPQAG